MHYNQELPILSVVFLTAMVDSCSWSVRLCELGDPLKSPYVCNMNLNHQHISGGMEKQELNIKVNPVIKSLTDQPVDTEETTYYGFPYYLRIDLNCGNEERSRKAMQEALYTGLNPTVIVTVMEPVHPTLLKPQRLDIIMTSAPLQDDVPCDSETCQFGWYIPMPIINGSVFYRIKVMSNGQGLDVPEGSFAIGVNGFMNTQTAKKDQAVSFGAQQYPFKGILSSDTASRALCATAERAPVMVLPGIPNHKTVLISSSEFDYSTLIELGIESCWIGSAHCPQLQFEVKIHEAISLESTVFIRQNQLIHQFIGNYSMLALQASSSDAWKQVLRSVCVENMVPVPTSQGGKEFFYVLGGGHHRGTLWRADVKDGESTFTELRDSKHRTICEFMNTIFNYEGKAYCMTRWVTHRADEVGTSIILQKLMYSSNDWSYHVITHDTDFHKRGSLPKYIPDDSGTSFMVANGMTPDTNYLIIMIGIVYNPNSGILYLWGNCLICSFDEGLTFLFVRGFPISKAVKYFSLSYHGEFAFVTTGGEVWWGQEGVDTVAQVLPSLGWSIYTTLELVKGSKWVTSSFSILTLFWDSRKQLQLVVYSEGGENTEGSVMKLKIPVAEVLSYSLFSATSTPSYEVTDYGTHSTFRWPQKCSFFSEHLEDLPQPEPYNRIQQYTARPPLVSHPSGLQSTASLATYQGLLHHILKLHTEYTQDIGDPAQNPIARWLKDKMVLEDYYIYLSSNEISSSGFSVEMDSFSRMYENPEISLPYKVYLDLHASFSFSIYISTGSPTEMTRGAIKNIRISAEVSDEDFIYVKVFRQEFFNRAAIVHKVTVSDRGAFPGQALAGEKLRPFTLLLKVSGSEMKCFQDTNRGIVGQGQHRLTVYIGCPPGKRMAFDISRTLEETAHRNKRYFDCPYPSPNIPCFYYNDVFYPFFLIQDMVSGESGPFLGSYTFKIVGGGAYSRKNIRYYSPQEVLIYNNYNETYPQTLMWINEGSPKSVSRTEEGFTVLSEAQNKIRWLCQRNSPCGDLSANRLMAPDFFFIIEVSNKGVDMSTYCDYALRFEIHVHGFPLDPTRALYYMLMTLAAICVFLFCYVVFHCCGPGFKTLGMAAYHAAKTHQQVEQESDTSVELDDSRRFSRARR